MHPSLPQSFLSLLMAAASASAQQGDDPLLGLADLPVQAAVVHGVEVLVLGVDGRPCGEAVVLAANGENLQRRARAVADLRRRFADEPLRATAAVLRLCGTRRAVDASGRTAVSGGGPLELLAAAGDAYAFALVPAAADPAAQPKVQLQLQRPRSLRVQVTTADGKPAAGAEVGVVRDGAGLQRAAAVRTAADGTAELPVPVVAMGLSRVVRAFAATALPVEQPLPLQDTLHLQLPPCGSLHIEAAAGVAVRSFEVWRDAPRQLLLQLPPSTAGGNAADLPFVQPGTGLTVVALVDGLTMPIAAPVPPIAAGARTVLQLAAPAPRRSVVVQLSGVDGEPLATCELRVAMVCYFVMQETVARTDVAGRLEHELPDNVPPGSVLLIEKRPFAAVDDAAGADYVELPLAGVGPGRNDRGAQRLQTAPLLLGGHVVDGHGRAVAGLRLQVQANDPVRQTATTTAADGSFALHMRAPLPASVEPRLDPDWIRLGHADAFAPGRDDVELKVAPVARLQVGLTPVVPDGTVALLRLRGREKNGARFEQTLPAPQGLLQLPAGTWDFVVVGVDEVMAIDGVKAEAGIDNHDPRLMQLDWSAFATLATLHLVPVEGQPLPACQVKVGLGNGLLGCRSGTVHLLLPKAGARVVVQPVSPQLRVVDLGVVTGDRTVQLQPAATLHLTLSAPPKLPDGLELRGLMTVHDLDLMTPPFRFDAAGKASCAIRGKGTYRLQLVLARPHGPVLGAGIVTTLAEAIDVDDRDLEHRVEMTTDLQQAIDAAAARIQAPIK